MSINTCDLLGADKKTSERKRVMRLAVDNLVSGRPITIGPGDGRIIATRDRANSLNLSETNANETLGTELGEITRKVIAGGRNPVRRIVVEGGDTAGRIQKVLRIEALQISKPVGIGAPLCYVSSKRAVVNGLEMAFKGGQAEI